MSNTNYILQPKYVKCRYYVTWKSMIRRCYSESWLETHPTYVGTKVCEEWLTFSNFKVWMEKQDWEGKELDKDLLGDGRLYSPETCCFIHKPINGFLVDTTVKSWKYPIGVCFHKKNKNFVSHCKNPFLKKKVYLGSYNTPEEAHAAWKAYKHSITLQYAEEVDDPRIKEALRTRYL